MIAQIEIMPQREPNKIRIVTTDITGAYKVNHYVSTYMPIGEVLRTVIKERSEIVNEELFKHWLRK